MHGCPGGRGKETAWGMITPPFNLHTNDLYPFVFDGNAWKTVAHGAIPDRTGHVPYSILNAGDKQMGTAAHELYTDGHFWVEYVFTSPGTGTSQYKRTCLALHDGYVFGSGYCLPDARIQSVTDGIIHGFGEGGMELFGTTLGQDGQLAGDATFGAVLDRADAGLVAIGVTGAWLEDLGGLPVEADRPMIGAWHEVHGDGRAWLERVTVSTATGTEQVMGQLWQLEGDYVYISGHYLPDAGAQSAVDRAAAAYHLHGQDGFGVVTPEEPVDVRDGFAFVLDGDGTVVAHGADSGMVDATTALPSTEPGWADDGAARARLYQHDGYLSGLSCDIRDAGVEAAVRNMAHLDNAGHDVVDLANHRHVPGDVMPFVMDVDDDYLEHPGFRAGAPSGMLMSEDGAGIWHDGSVWLYRAGGLVFGAVHAG